MRTAGLDQRGFVSVFLLLVLFAAVLVIGVFAEAAAGIAARAYGNSVIDLAGRSILSEYDRNLKREYGLFGVVTDPERVSRRLNLYIEDSLVKKRGKADLLQLRIRNIHADLSPYAFTNLELIEGQILDHMKYQAVKEGLSALEYLYRTGELDSSSGAGAVSKTDKDAGDEGVEANGDHAGSHKERILLNEKVFRALPSKELGVAKAGLPELPKILELDQLAGEAREDILINLYILREFRHRMDSGQWSDTFYANEIEYVLFGKRSDAENRQLTRLSLLAFRTTMALTHIYSDPEKREALAIAANLISPGPGAPAAQILLAGAWAAAEAANDLSRLEEGGRVPLIKTSEDWALDLESVIQEIAEPAQKEGADGEGLSYENYLFFLLCFKSREIRLARIMDLIQLNLQGNYYEGFLMKECYGGLDIHCTLERQSGFFSIAGRRGGSFLSSHVY